MLNDKQTVIHPYNEILSNRKNRAIDSHNMYEFKMHFAMQEARLKGYKLYNSTMCMTFWEKQNYRNGTGKWL